MQSATSTYTQLETRLYNSILDLANHYQNNTTLWSRLCDELTLTDGVIRLNSTPITEKSSIGELSVANLVLKEPFDANGAKSECLKWLTAKLRHCSCLENNKRTVVRKRNISSEVAPEYHKCLLSEESDLFMIDLTKGDILAKSSNKYGVKRVEPSQLEIIDLNYIIRSLVAPL